ncbi:hypothetical protein Tco_0929607, partial [Tanacetum coccineum]
IVPSLLGLVQDHHRILPPGPPHLTIQGKTNKPPARTTSAVDLEEFCKKHYEKLLPIMADKYEYEQRKKEKLEEVKAQLDFGEARKKRTRAQESAYSESRTMSLRRQRRSCSLRHNPSVFNRLRRERSRSPWHEYKRKARRESTVFKRLGSRGRSTSMHFDSRQESLRYTKNHSESEDSEGGHWKSKSRRKKSSVEDDDLSQPWVCAETDLFTSRIRHFDFPKTRMPSHVKTYNGSEDPKDHLKIFQAAAKTERWAMPTWCHMFNSTLTGNARKKCIRDPIVLHNIKQRDGESTEDFIQRYKSESGNVKGALECMRISGFLYGITNPELIKRFHEKIPKNSRRNDAGGHIFPSRARGGLKSRKEKSPSGLETLGRGDDEHSTSAWMDSMVVRSTSPHNGIIGRPGPEDQPIPVNKVKEERVKVAINPEHPEQTVMIGSNLTEKARVKLWEHRLNVREGCQPVRQKKRCQAAKRNIAINDKVSKLVAAGIMREVHYHDWLSNPVMVKKNDNS